MFALECQKDYEQLPEMLHDGTRPWSIPSALHSNSLFPSNLNPLLQVYVTFPPHVTLSVSGILEPLDTSGMPSHSVTTKFKE